MPVQYTRHNTTRPGDFNPRTGPAARSEASKLDLAAKLRQLRSVFSDRATYDTANSIRAKRERNRKRNAARKARRKRANT